MRTIKRRPQIIVLITLVMLFAPKLWSATYYVTQTGVGNGGSYATAMSVVAHNANTYNFQPGDIVYLCDTINSQVTLPASGSPGLPIVYRGDYDVAGGHAGIVDRSTAITSWTDTGSNNIWYATTSAGYIIEDGIPLKHGTSELALTAGQWFHVSGTRYYRPTTGVPSGHVVAGPNSYGILFTDRHDISFYYITVRYCSAPALFADENTTTSNNIIVDHCTFQYNGGGVNIASDSPAIVTGIVYTNNTCISNCCSLNLCISGTTADNRNGANDGYIITGNTITWAGSINASLSWWDVLYGDGASSGIDLESIGIQNGTNGIIANNTSIGGAGRGIYMYSQATVGFLRNNKIYNNYFKDLGGFAISVSGPSSGVEISGNEVYNNYFSHCGWASSSHTYKIAVLANVAAPTTTYNTFYNNTLDADFTGTVTNYSNTPIEVMDYWRVKNNIIYVTNSNPGTAYSYAITAGSYTHLDIDYNCIYPSTLSFYRNGAVRNLAYWQGVSLFDIHSQTTNPLLTGYVIDPASACKDHGTNTGVTVDIRGQTRPQNVQYDIGAYEVGASLELYLTNSSGSGSAQANPNASLGGYRSTTPLSSTSLKNLFDDVTGLEAIIGDVEYRMIDVYNPASYDIKKVQLFMKTPTSSTSTELAFGYSATDQPHADSWNGQVLSNEGSAPSSPAFSFANRTRGSPLSLGTIPAGQSVRVGIRRTVNALSPWTTNDIGVIGYRWLGE